MVAVASPHTLVDACLVRCFAGLPEELERCGCVLGEVTSRDVPLVRWRLPNDELLPHAALVYTGSDIVARAEAGESLGGIVAVLPRTTLVAVGPPPAKLERVLTSVQLECGISVRRVLNVAELAELLAALGGALGRAASRSDEPEVAFLSGLTSRDVLYNQKVPRGPSEAWLGALKQILPERSALVLRESFPTARSIYKHYREADDPQGARRVWMCRTWLAATHPSRARSDPPPAARVSPRCHRRPARRQPAPRAVQEPPTAPNPHGDA